MLSSRTRSWKVYSLSLVCTEDVGPLLVAGLELVLVLGDGEDRAVPPWACTSMIVPSREVNVLSARSHCPTSGDPGAIVMDRDAVVVGTSSATVVSDRTHRRRRSASGRLLHEERSVKSKVEGIAAS